MPIHDWTRVIAGVFHDFHGSWIAEIKKALNAGLLPAEYYAMADARPRVDFHARAEIDIYAAKAKSVVIRHLSGHKIVAIIEIVSPGNKSGQTEFAAFVQEADQAILSGIHLLIVDLFPPTKRDPCGIHRVIWGREGDGDFALPDEKPLTCVSYVGYPGVEVYLQPVAVNSPLPDMPLFLTREIYVPIPLEATYRAAWETVPRFWRDALTAAPENGPKQVRRGRKRKK